MPKANHGGATAAGMTGIVEHGAPLPDGRTLSELDPELNLDGTLIEGEHPDHADAERRNEQGYVVTEPRPIDEELRTEEQSRADTFADHSADEEDERTETEREADRNAAESRPEEEPSAGNSSTASPAKMPNTRGKSASTRR